MGRYEARALEFGEPKREVDLSLFKNGLLSLFKNAHHDR
jgi:hypothetical protein